VNCFSTYLELNDVKFTAMFDYTDIVRNINFGNENKMIIFFVFFTTLAVFNIFLRTQGQFCKRVFPKLWQSSRF
jgi:hypothetical protein